MLILVFVKILNLYKGFVYKKFTQILTSVKVCHTIEITYILILIFEEEINKFKIFD